MLGDLVLLVDDEPMVREVLARYLARDGFEVVTASDGEEALAAVAQASPQLVLLDLMLPGVDGFDVFRRMPKREDIPVIMLTARGDETDRIAGLDMGADDYIAKPFSPAEVVARVRAVLRRGARLRSPSPPKGERPNRYGALQIDGRGRTVWKEHRPIELTPKEFDLLFLLASNPGRVFTRIELLEEVWDFAFEGDPSTVTVHVRRLREKIEDDASKPIHLVTVWGVGYRFEP